MDKQEILDMLDDMEQQALKTNSFFDGFLTKSWVIHMIRGKKEEVEIMAAERGTTPLKYGVKFYADNGDFLVSDYKDDFYLILQLYVQYRKYYNSRPSLWVFDGNDYVRVHDFNYRELSPETYRKYLAERIVSGDDLLVGIHPVGAKEIERLRAIEGSGEDA